MNEDNYAWVDEQSLDRIDRLGLAYCRLNSWQWDEILGEKPSDFDDLPNYIPHSKKLWIFHRKERAKYDYITPMMEEIQKEIGEVNASRCWWKFEKLGEEKEWREWYYSRRKNEKRI